VLSLGRSVCEDKPVSSYHPRLRFGLGLGGTALAHAGLYPVLGPCIMMGVPKFDKRGIRFSRFLGAAALATCLRILLQIEIE